MLRNEAGNYGHRHPGPADVLLLIEVSGTSLAFDRDVKLPLYALAGIPEAWLVNLEQQQVEIHREPGPACYRSTATVQPGNSITPQAFPEVTIVVDDVLA